MRVWRVVRFSIYFLVAAAIILLAIIFLFTSTPSSNLPKNLIVLAKDPDGTIGTAAVSNPGGQQVLSKPRQATGVSSDSEPPPPPIILSEKDINDIFGDVLKARPRLPSSFSLRFDLGASILATAGPQIDHILAEIKRRPVWQMTIYAYASGVGSIPINKAAALFRGQALSSALASRGIDTSKIAVRTIIDPHAVVQGPDGRTLPDNRRIEVVIR